LIIRECFSKPLYSRGTPRSSPLSSYISLYRPISSYSTPQKMENCFQDGETRWYLHIYSNILTDLPHIFRFPLFYLFWGYNIIIHIDHWSAGLP
jgi:hypothetical protein